MNIQIETYNELVGFHYWENAPEQVSFLRNPHRHRFVIRCFFSVDFLDREKEIFMFEDKVQKFLVEKYGDPMRLNNKSCEMLACELVNYLKCDICEVLEDGKGGAIARC